MNQSIGLNVIYYWDIIVNALELRWHLISKFSLYLDYSECKRQQHSPNSEEAEKYTYT